MRGLLAALVLLASPALAAPCVPDEVELRGPFGQARFTIELADDAAERAQGLMGRTHLPAGAGMLFVFPGPQRALFWMRNTPIALDLIFLDGGGRVVGVHENAIPFDETLIDGGPGILAVLEINGGLAGAIGIGPGAEMRHSAFGDQAAWPCAPAP